MHAYFIAYICRHHHLANIWRCLSGEYQVGYDEKYKIQYFVLILIFWHGFPLSFLLMVWLMWQSYIVLLCWYPIINIKHDDVIKWKHFPRYWPFVWGIHRPPVNSPHKGQWHGDLVFSLFCAWINGSVNNRKAGDLRRHRAHYDVTVMKTSYCQRYATAADLKIVSCWQRPADVPSSCQITPNRLFVQQPVRAYKETWVLCIAGPLLGESTCDREIPLTKGQ